MSLIFSNAYLHHSEIRRKSVVRFLGFKFHSNNSNILQPTSPKIQYALLQVYTSIRWVNFKDTSSNCKGGGTIEFCYNYYYYLEKTRTYKFKRALLKNEASNPHTNFRVSIWRTDLHYIKM